MFGVLAHLPVLGLVWLFMPLGFLWEWVARVGGHRAEDVYGYAHFAGILGLLAAMACVWIWALGFAASAPWLQRYEHAVWIMIVLVSGSLGPLFFFWAQAVPAVNRGVWRDAIDRQHAEYQFTGATER